MKTQTRKISYYFLVAFVISALTTTRLFAESLAESDFKAEIKTFFKDAFEIPRLGMPDVKIEKSGLAISTSAFLHINQYMGTMKMQSDNLFKNQLDLTHRDHLIFYGLIDSTVKLDLGINVMKFNNNLRLSNNGIVSDVNIDKYTPALYAHAEYASARGNISLVTEGSVHNLGNSSISDYKLYINLSNNTTVDTEIGFHRFDAEWQNIDSDNENMSFKGYYARVTYNF